MPDRPNWPAAGYPLRVLIVEDDDGAAQIVVRKLMQAGYTVNHRRTDTVARLKAALAERWDVVLSEYSLPTMSAHDVLHILSVNHPSLPCIVLSGTITEDAAVEVLREGARDFIVKERMARLVPAIQRELREAAEKRRLEAAEATLRDMRERMQFALESVGIGTWEVDLSTGRTIWSAGLERLHGFDPEGFGGTFDAFADRIHPDDRGTFLERIGRPQGEGSDFRVEYRAIRADGAEHWILSIGRTLYDQVGRPVRAVGVGMDITSQKRLEQQYHQAQKMETIGNLAGGIAHDFNNLLTVIMGCCDLLEPCVAGDRAASEWLGTMRSAAVSASALTRQLLTFSRRQVVLPRIINLNDTITAFQKILRRVVEENVHLEWKLAPALPPVSADPGQVEQVLLNLVANARDAMADGGTVTVATEQELVTAAGVPGSPEDLPPGPYVVLSVSDTGTGMTEAVKAHLFEPFFTTKPVGRGTGLGLATVYGIVKQSNGYLAVLSAPGAGTTFRIYLPEVATAAAAAAADQARQLAAAGDRTILLVEDSAPLRRLTESLLRGLGYQVMVAANGAQAQQICRDHQGAIDVALLDVVMPGESGVAVGEWIVQHRPETKIIYTSGYTGDSINQDRLGQPEVMFLQKPFNANQLARAIRDVLSPGESGDS